MYWGRKVAVKELPVNCLKKKKVVPDIVDYEKHATEAGRGSQVSQHFS